MLHEVQRILTGQIVVGHELYLEVTGLIIPLDSVFGIRDLAAATVLLKYQIPCEEKFYNLKSICQVLVNKNMPKLNHDSLQDAKTILEIYKKG